MSRRNLTSVITAIFTLVYIISVAHGQSQDQPTMELLADEKIVLPERTSRPLLIADDKQIYYANIVYSDDKTTLIIPNRPNINLPPVLETLVSEDGQTIVQFGDEQDQSHPQRTNIYWFDGNGNAVSQIVNYYAEDTLVSMSEDGFTAVAGPLFKDRNTTVLSLYTAVGGKLWEIVLDKDKRPAILRVAQGENYVVLVTTDKQDWLKHFRLNIINKQAKTVSSIDRFRIIQKLVVVNTGKHIFVQGYNDYGLVEISSGSVLWRNPQKIRMASPYGAKTDPLGRVLFLALADFKGKLQATYRWKLVALNVDDGKERVSVWLPGEHAGTRNRVFEQISTQRVLLRTPTTRFTYSWQVNQEGK